MVEPIDIRAGLTDPSILGIPPTPPVEPPQPVTPPVETPPVPPEPQPAVPEPQLIPPAEPVPTQAVEFKIDAFNKWLEANNYDYRIETEDQLKQVIGSLNEVEILQKEAEEYAQKKPYLEELENELQALVNREDPANTLSPEQYKAYLVAQKLLQGKNIQDTRVQALVQNIALSDLTQLNDLDVVSYGWQYDSPKFAGQEVEIRRIILKEIGLDEDVLNDPGFKLSEVQLTPEQELRLSRMAKAERDRFSSVKDSVKPPEKKDWKSILQEKVEKRQQEIQAARARIESLKGGWADEAKRTAESLKSVEFLSQNEQGQSVPEFTFEVDADFKKLIPDMVIGYALEHNLEPTQENAKAIGDLVKGVYVLKNIERMIPAFKKDVESKLREQFGKDIHNGRPINTGGPPPDRAALTEADLANIVAENLLKR